MIEKLLFLLSKVPAFFWWAFASAIMLTATQFLVGNWLWLGAAYLPVILFIEAISRSPGFVARMLSRRNLLAFIVVCVLVVTSSVLSFLSHGAQGPVPAAPTGPSPSPYLYVTFFVIGAILGVLLREAFGQFVYAALLDKKRLAQSMLVMGIWNLVIILYPLRDHVATRPWYLLGIAAGIAMHKGSRFSVARAAAAYRRIQNIADAWPPTAAATPAEWKALELLERGRQLPGLKFRKLRHKIEEWRGTEHFTNRLALISASVFRLEGNYDRALQESVDYATNSSAPEDAHLLLLKAVNLAEVGYEMEAGICLEELLHSPVGSQCPLACW
jgi:hypothetical protein